PMSRAPPPPAEFGMPFKPRSMMLEEVCVPVVGASVRAPEAGAPEAPLPVPVNVRSASRIMLHHLCFVVEDRINGADREATERGHDLTIPLLETQQDVGLVHCLQIEIGADDAVAVDHHAAH